jgi:hypothetical protein
MTEEVFEQNLDGEREFGYLGKEWSAAAAPKLFC